MHSAMSNNLTVLFLTTTYTVVIYATWLWCRPW